MSIHTYVLKAYLQYHFDHQYASVESLPDEDDRVESVIETAFNRSEYACSNFDHWCMTLRPTYYQDLIEPNNLFRMLRDVGKWFDDNFDTPLDYSKLTPEWTINAYAYMLAKEDEEFISDFIEQFIAENTPVCKMCDGECRENDLCGHGVADGVCCICDDCHCESDEDDEDEDEDEEMK